MGTALPVLDDEHRARRLKVIGQTSASQIDQYEQCPRKWLNASVLGDRQPQTDAQKRGVDIDDNYVQPYLKTGMVRADGDWAKLLKELIPNLPKPGPRDDLLVQQRIELATYDGGPLCVGYADWIEELPDDHLHVGDLKSTSDFKYCKSEAELVDNTQMVTYARWAFEVGARTVSIAHVYGRTRGAARAHRSPLLRDAVGYFVSGDQIAERWGRRVEVVKEMVAAARSCAKADDLPPNTASCGAYGGCYYRGKCGLTVASLVAIGVKKEKPMDGKGQSRLLKMLRGDGSKAEAPTEAVVAPPKEVQTGKPAIRSLFAKKPLAQQSPAEKGVEGYQPGQKCNGKGYYASANGQGFVDVEEGHSCANCAKVEIAPDQVLPPETVNQRESTPAEVEAADEAARAKGKAKKEKTAAKKGTTIKCERCEEVVPVAEYESHSTAHDEEEKSASSLADKIEAIGDSRGESEMAAAASNLADEVRAKVPTPKRDPKVRETSQQLQMEMAKGKEPAGRKAPMVKPWIVVDGACMKLPDQLVAAATMLEEWLAPMIQMVAEANGVDDIRLLSYGQAKGGLATAMRERIDTCPAVLLVNSKHPDAALALEVLAPHAEVVFKGVAA